MRYFPSSPAAPTGLLGVLLTGVVDFFQRRQDHAQEMELRRFDLDLARIEGESAGHVAAIEAEGRADEAAWSALEESYREASRRWSRPGEGWLMQFVDFVRGMTRPMLTWCLVGLVAAIYFWLGATDMEVIEIRPRIIDTVLYLATASVLWWFGARQIAKRSEARQ